MARRLTDLTEIRRLAATGEAQRIRTAAGASRREMGTEVGVSHVTIGRWEDGDAVPHGDAAVRWLKALRSLEAVVES